MDKEETAETLTDVSTRIIKQITVDDVSKADILFNQLMGETVAFRKQFLKDHGWEAEYNAE